MPLSADGRVARDDHGVFTRLTRAMRWPYIAPIAIVLLAWSFLVPRPALGDSFIFWGAGHLVVSGASPYDRAAWETVSTSVPGDVAVNTLPWILEQQRSFWTYPPQTAVVFAPFGALPPRVGVPLVQIFVLLTTLLAVVVCARTAGLEGARLAFGLAVATAAEPVAIAMRVGQPDGLVLLGAALAYVGARDRRAGPLAIGVVLLSIKPHVVAVLALGLVLYLARRDRRLLGVATGALGVVTLACNALWPYPFPDLADALRGRPTQDVATTLALARDLGGGPLLAAALIVCAVAAAVIAVRSAPGGHRGPVAYAAALALSLGVAPYAHDHDLVLLVPAFFVVLLLLRGTRHEVPVTAVMGLIVVIVPWVYLVARLEIGGVHSSVEGPLGALPAIAVIGLATACGAASRTSRSPRAVPGAPLRRSGPR